MSMYAVNPKVALGRLKVIPDYDPGDGPKPCVHTFLAAGGVLVGAHWSVKEVKRAMKRYGVEEAGEQATAMHHGLAIMEPGRPIFLETLT